MSCCKPGSHSNCKRSGTCNQLTHGRELSEEDLVAVLNRDPDRCFDLQRGGPPRVHVIGWGLWALQLQHHFCHAVATDFNSLQRKLGLSDEARTFADECEKKLGTLRFYAFVRRLDCTDAEEYRRSTDQGWAFAAAYPHLTPVAWMDHLCRSVSFAPPLPTDSQSALQRMDVTQSAARNCLRRGCAPKLS